ncbi:hypothetical protein [Methylobacterium terrae]|uniref:hypothetical protein n=1 Tax=Methylobacterium terrae TaxID=2202827 RepID=UPI0013A5740B|nr:hypothetical protein [Methylobacterium terrae]
MKLIVVFPLVIGLMFASCAAAQWNGPEKAALRTQVTARVGKVNSLEITPFYGDYNSDAKDDALVFAYYEDRNGGNSMSLDVFLFKGTAKGFSFVKKVPNVYGSSPRMARFGPGSIKVTLTTLGPNDPRCCPTATKEYTITAK